MVSARAQAAIEALELDRAEISALFGPNQTAMPGGGVDAFPRSQTVRWLLRHPIGRWVGSAFMTTVLARFPLGRLANVLRVAGST
jgi:hypothetical protein